MKDITILVYSPTVTDLEISKSDLKGLMSDLNKNNFYHIDERGRSLYFLCIRIIFVTIYDDIHDSVIDEADYVCLSRFHTSDNKDVLDSPKFKNLRFLFPDSVVIYDLDLVQLAIFLRCMNLNPMGLLKFVDDSGLKSSESTINRLFKDSMAI